MLEDPPAMKEKTTEGQSKEQSLVKLYMELTGTTEANARSVLMYVDSAGEEMSGESEMKAAQMS